MPFAPPALVSLRNALGVPSTRIPIDGVTFVSYVLPPVVFYFIMALLVVTPHTRTVRIALWPLVVLLAWRAALSIDLSPGEIEQDPKNSNFALFMYSMATRSLGWTFEKRPLVRHLRPANSSPSTIMDALDLTSNFRGIGWNWSDYRSYTPRETRPANRTAFVLYVSLSAATHSIMCGVFRRAIMTFIPTEVASIPGGSTIFDDALPFPIRYLRSTFISVLAAVMLYSALQMTYDTCTVSGILVLGQDPAQWPPAFDAPWRATSLSDFWGRRWHQFFRHIFLLCSRPLSVVLGRPGIVIGAFIGSVLWHNVTVTIMNNQVETWWMWVGFVAMAPGILAERAFRRLTGKRVGGPLGWVWTMTWLAVWGNVIIEGFVRAGMYGTSSPLDTPTLLRAPVERLVTRFDAWLHAI